MIRIPYANGRVKVSSPYGSRMLNGSAEFHNGIDLVGLDTKQIVSPVNGVCVRSRIVTDTSNLTWQWGNYVCICGEDGMYYYMCHMSERCVEEGQMVRTGDIIGIEGNTGYSFGSHCHFEARLAQGGGAYDPSGNLGIQNVEGYIATVEAKESALSYEEIAEANGCHDWSKDAVVDALKKGIIKGDGNSLGLFEPLTVERYLVFRYREQNGDDGK